MPFLNFVPERDGFHFANEFSNRILPGTPVTFTTSGLCGGMCMAAIDYWRAGVPIPTHRAGDIPSSPVDNGAHVPAEGTRLRAYVYRRQLDSLLTKAMFTRWITMPWIGPEQFHDWAIGSEFDVVRNEIGRGRPTLLGLWSMAAGDPLGGHQIVCYGWDEGPRRLYCYDPNHPDEESILTPVSPQAGVTLVGSSSRTVRTYRGYFWTDVYNWAEAPKQPEYIDLAVTGGVDIKTSGQLESPVRSWGTVGNLGEYPSRFDFLYTWSRGPGGVNTDAAFGGREPGVKALQPGDTHVVTRQANGYGSASGTHQVGLSYMSNEGHWRQLPARWPAVASRTFDLFPSKTLIEDRWFSIPEGAANPIPTNLRLQPGDEIALTGMGRIWAGVWFTGENGPEGWTDRVETNPNSPMHGTPDSHPFSLIGRYGASPWFYIGSGRSRHPYGATAAEALELWINDDTPGNGSGEFRCRVQIWR